MRLTLRKLLAAVLTVALAGAGPIASTHAVAKRKPKKTFTAEGTVYGAGLITHENFIVECPAVPTTQGVDAYVVEVPQDFGLRPSIATVDATSVSVEGQLELSFYTWGCDQGELYLNPPVEVPAGTGFIVVQDIQGGNIDFKLTLTQK